HAAWTTYNVHKVVTEDERGGTALIGPAGLVTGVEARHQLAAAADFAQRVPRVIHDRLSPKDGPQLGKAGPLALPALHAAWITLLDGLRAGRGNEAVHAWREAVTEEAVQLVERDVNARSPHDRTRVVHQVTSYLRAIPVDAHPYR